MSADLKCDGCGRFVRDTDPRVEWDVEYGDYGVVLSRTPTACGHCARMRARFHAGHAIALHMVIELARQVPLSGDDLADRNVRNAMARAREVQAWLEPLATDSLAGAPVPAVELSRSTPNAV